MFRDFEASHSERSEESLPPHACSNPQHFIQP